MTAAQAYRVNRMIQDLNSDPAFRAAFAADRNAVFDRYGVDARQRALLADGSIEAMTELGVHPNLQMKWMFISAGGPPQGPGPLAAYLDWLTGS